MLLYFIGPYGGAFAYVILLMAAMGAAAPLSLAVTKPPKSPFWETFRRGWDSFRKEANSSLRQLAPLEAIYGFFSAVPPLLITALAFERLEHRPRPMADSSPPTPWEVPSPGSESAI